MTAAQTYPMPVSAPAETNKWLVTMSIGFGSLMASIDSSIVNVAMPHIRGAVGATIQEITWVSTAYIIAMVLVMPLTGFLGALFGQKRVYLASLFLFVLGSMLCGIARSLPTLVAYRALQGFGGGALQPTQQAILRQTFPPREQGMAMAMFGMVIMIGPAVGPTLGGWLTDNYSWPWIFYINVPIGALGIFMTWRFVHEPEDVLQANHARAIQQRKNLDIAGIVLLAIAVATLQYVLEEGARNDWFESETIRDCTFVCVLATATFIVRELTATAPVVDLRLFRDRTYASATALGGVMFAMLMGSMFLLPVFMQELLGYDATQSGLALMPRTLAMVPLMPVVGRLYNRVHPAVMIGIGVVLFGAGSYEFSHMTLESSEFNIMLPMIITGCGFAFLFIPLATVALEHIPRARLADAAGLNSFVRQIGGSIGLTIFATLLERYATRAMATVGTHVTLLRPEVSQQVAGIQALLIRHGMDVAGSQAGAVRALAGRVALQAMVLAYEKVFLLQGIVFMMALPLLLFLKVDSHRHSGPVELPVE
jgi:DHA2 family multidrug resistance protein